MLRQLSQETGGRAFFPNQVDELTRRLRPDRRRAVEPVHRRLHVAQPQARRRVAPRRRPRQPAEHDGAHQTGIFRADALQLRS